MRRRELLRAGILSLAAAKCSAPAGETRHALPDTANPALPGTVSIVRAANYSSVAGAVRAAIDLAGRLTFIRPGDSVLLKPAVNSTNRYPATTDPEVVLAVAQLVLAAGGKPFVADRTMFLRSTAEAFRATGILDAAQQAGIRCVALEDTPVVTIAHRLAANWPVRQLPVYQLAAQADHIINLCTPRTHKLGDVTMAIKNNVGLVAGSKRARMHMGGGFKARLAEISLVLRPSLIVLDGRAGFADDGPDEGPLVKPGLIAVGSDPLAVDAVGVAMLRTQGTNATLSSGSLWDIPILRRAAEIGLGAPDAKAVRLNGTDDLSALSAKLL